MAQPRLTIGMPTCNRPHFLKEALQSVLAQDYGDFAVLVCDNSSNGETEALVRSLGDARLHYHHHPKNIGMQRNWQYSISAPRTEFVALLEDDNLHLPHHLGAAIEALDAHPNVAYYASAYEAFGNRESTTFATGMLDTPPAAGLTVCDAAAFATRVLRCVPNVASSWVMRRPALDTIETWGGKSWPAAMDWLWMGQMLLSGGMVFDSQVGIKYRWHETNVTHSWQKSGVVTCEIRYIVRTLVKMAQRKGLLTPERLVADAVGWPPMEASVAAVALAGDEDPAWRAAALEIYRQHPNILGQGASKHVKIAARIGTWYLRYADKLHRLRYRWPPKDRE